MAHFCLLLFFIGSICCVFSYLVIPDTHLAEEGKAGGYALFCLLVLKCPSQQFFSHFEMISCLPGLN